MMLKMMECKLHQTMRGGGGAEPRPPPPHAAVGSAKQDGHGSVGGQGEAGFSQQWTLDSMGQTLQSNHADVLRVLEVRCAAGTAGTAAAGSG